jgi:hypothetical protein
MMRTKRWYLYPLVVAAMFMMWSAPAGAVITQAPGDMGDVLLGASYDLQAQPFDREGERTDAWENFIEIQNTSDDWVAVHVRFRESEKSLEVWDHPILLSPKDVFWAYMIRNDQGQVEFRSGDFDTLYHSGLIDRAQLDAQKEFNPTNNGDLAVFSPFLIAMTQGIANPTSADYTPEMWERTQLGYMEAIGLWSFDGVAPANYPQTNDGLVHTLEWDAAYPGYGIIDPYTYTKDGMADSANIFDILKNVWGDSVDHPAVQGNGYAINQREVDAWGQSPDNNYHFEEIYLEDAGNVLKGTIEMGDITTGQYIVNNMVALQDFRVDGVDYRDETTWAPIVYHPDLYLSGRPFGSAGNDYPFVYTDIAYYLNPDWATTKGPTLRDGDNTDFDFDEAASDFNDVWSLYAVEAALAKDNIWTFYLNDTPFRTSRYETDITMTMPTKHLHFGVEFTGITDTGEFPFWNDGTYVKTSNSQNIYDYLMDVADARKIVGDTCTADVAWDGKIWDTHENSPVPYKEKSPEYAAFEFAWPYESFIFRISEMFADYDTSIFEFDMGQITFTNWTMANGDRDLSEDVNQLPIIGFTSRVHEYTLDDSAVLPFRSASHPWQWN